MPVYFLPETPEDKRLSEFWDYYQRTENERNVPCGLCLRASRKTTYGYMCWECQEQKPVWQAHLDAFNKAEYERQALAYVGPCVSCAKRLTAGDFECVTCRAEWGA